MQEDVFFACGEYTVLLRGGYRVLEESLLEAAAYLWLQEADNFESGDKKQAAV